jgi:hypothetical protein
MKARNIFLFSIAFAALVIIAFAAFIPAASAGGNKKELTECERQELKYKPAVDAFKRSYLAARIFNPVKTYQAIQGSDSTGLARHKFASLDSDKRRAVWKAHFDQIDVGDFNPAQKEFFDRVVGSLDGMKFDGTDDKEAGKAFIHEGVNLFTKSQFMNLFGGLKTTAGIMKARAQMIPECECNYSTLGYGDDFCPLIPPHNLKCKTYVTCVRRNPGCGWLWSWVCDGLCLPTM